MNMSNIDTAAREYASRPQDERFSSVEALVQHARDEQARSKEIIYPMSQLALTSDAGQVKLVSGKGTAQFSHWAFGQFCRAVGAPANYMRDIAPELAASCLNYSLSKTRQQDDAKMSLLVKAPNGNPSPVVRAVTTDSYTRLWDGDFYGPIVNTIMQHGDWKTPPTWDGKPAGAYRGDRDSFVILVNGGSIVEDPSLLNEEGDASKMFRGILLRNSEVGSASIVIEQILFRFICGNHMLWGAVSDRTYRRRHIGSTVNRDTIREIGKLAHEFSRQSAERDSAIIAALISHNIASDKDGVVKELRGMGLSKGDAEASFDECVKKEHASPMSYWGIAQGMTRVSQMAGYEDSRFIMDQIAAKVLLKGRQRVTA